MPSVPTAFQRNFNEMSSRRDGEDLTAASDIDGTDLIVLRQKREAVSRIVVGTYSDAATADSTVTLGGEVMVEGVDFEAGADEIESATNLVAAVTAASIPAASIVDNEDGGFTITFAAGVNTTTLSDNDPNLAFNQTQAGAAEYYETRGVTVEALADAIAAL